MTEEEVNNSIETGKVQLSKNEQTQHWLNFAGTLVFIGPIGGVIVYSAWYLFPIPVVVIGLFLRHKLTCTKLSVYKSSLTADQFRSANVAAAKLNGWARAVSSPNCFSAVSMNLNGQATKVTAILKDEKLYINSMVDPDLRSLPFVSRLNQKNRVELIQQYQSVLKGDDVRKIAKEKIIEKEEAFWDESEWTKDNILKRIAGYGLSFLLILVAIIIIADGKGHGIYYGILVLGIAGFFIYSDIKVILEKRKRRKNQEKDQ